MSLPTQVSPKEATGFEAQLVANKTFEFSEVRRVDILAGDIERKPRFNVQLSNIRLFGKLDASRFPNASVKLRPDEFIIIDHTHVNSRAFVVKLEDLLRNGISPTIL